MHIGTLIHPGRAAAVLVAAVAVLVPAAATAQAAPVPPVPPPPPPAAEAAPVPGEPAPAPVPPGPVRDLVLAPVPGGGARGIAVEARWAPPSGHGDASPTGYAVEITDVNGARLLGETTEETRSGPVYVDYCRAPITATVRALLPGPDGTPVPGPAVTASAGSDTTCVIHMSITAEQTAPGTLTVLATREQPIDPYVSGPCELTVDGAAAASGTCGGQADTVLTAEGLAPGPHELVLTTTSPRGVEHVATASATVTEQAPAPAPAPAPAA
ncbi:hypothetical protein [Pseudonocardia sp. HH130630-07]|uniref:hypothetical protein n=1 Tax=Pseudonocardia sp. HH130630-07 TaxID=1690815 RepID=UPI0008151EED|nr:hypothetical protein [Pseudonocardia sp. HH130630-07]ANY05683.1 hypothetical protein AFB00_04475 [Pseudonocardia sp. HH130630-07]